MPILAYIGGGFFRFRIPVPLPEFESEIGPKEVIDRLTDRLAMQTASKREVRCIECGFLGTNWNPDSAFDESTSLIEIQPYERREQRFPSVRCFLNKQDLLHEQIILHNPAPVIATRPRYCEFFFKYRPHLTFEGHESLQVRTEVVRDRLVNAALGGAAGFLVAVSVVVLKGVFA